MKIKGFCVDTILNHLQPQNLHAHAHAPTPTSAHTHTIAERIKACAKIKGFWVNTMLNHPQLKDLVGQNDEECLMMLNEVDVQEIDDEIFQVEKIHL